MLAKRRKALLIMGAGHFLRRDSKPGLIEQQMLSAFVKPYVIIAGSDVVRTYDDVDPRFTEPANLPAPWIMDLKGAWIGALPRWTDTPLIGFPSVRTGGTQSGTWEQASDAFLFLGPRDKLTTGGQAFDLNGTPYGQELRRRWRIIFPKPPADLPKSDGAVQPLFRRATPQAPALPDRPTPR